MKTNYRPQNRELRILKPRDVVKIRQSDGEVIEGRIAHVVNSTCAYGPALDSEDIIAIALFVDGNVVVSRLDEDELLEVNGDEVNPQVEFHGYVIRALRHYDGTRPEGEVHVGAFVGGTIISEETPVYDRAQQVYVSAPTWADGVVQIKEWLADAGKI